MFSVFLSLLALQTPSDASPAVRAQAAQTRPGLACVAAAETRAAIVRNKLADPSPALRTIARRGQAEPLRSRLCRVDDRFVYEMAMLRRDGKVVRVYVDALDGRTPVSVPR